MSTTKKKQDKSDEEYNQEKQDDSDEFDSQKGEQLFKKPLKQTTQEGNSYWELGNNKRVTVSRFKNNVYVNIREFYEKDGKKLPGSKGIALTAQLWENLKRCQKDIDKALLEETGMTTSKRRKNK